MSEFLPKIIFAHVKCHLTEHINNSEEGGVPLGLKYEIIKTWLEQTFQNQNDFRKYEEEQSFFLSSVFVTQEYTLLKSVS